jgi:hypothetical protein
MFRGKSFFTFVTMQAAFAVLGLHSLSAQASSSAAKRCAALATRTTALTNQAEMNGYFSLNQPIVMSGGSSGITEAQAREASQKKISEFQSWLAGAQSSLDNSGTDSSCSARQQAQSMIDLGRTLLASLKSFEGPYTEAQAKLSSSPAQVKDSYTLELPCRQKGTEENGLRECSVVIHDVTEWTESFLKKMADGIYHGCDLSDTGTVTDPTTCQPKNTVQTCNYFQGMTGIANTSPEQSTNHLQKACGQWISVGQHISGSQCMISANSMGTMEQSFYQGNSIRALDCHWNQVKNELSQGKLRLTAAIGLDAATKYATQIDMIKKARESLLAHKNIAQVDKCTAADLEGATPAKQSACMEYTHRLVLEQHLAHMAALEVVDRARRSFERFDAGTTGRAFFAEFKSYLQQNQGSSQCRGKSSDCNSASSAYLTRCYKPLFQQFFETRSNSVWSTEVCQ